MWVLASFNHCNSIHDFSMVVKITSIPVKNKEKTGYSGQGTGDRSLETGDKRQEQR
jgi:hypothetical protein